MNTIPIKTTNLTISVINPKKEIHYFHSDQNIDVMEVYGYRSLLDSLNCIYIYQNLNASVSINIFEPNSSVANILLYNMEYFEKMDITENDLFIEPEWIGDLKFWEDLSLGERIFGRHLFSSLTAIEIQDHYHLGKKWFEAKQSEFLKVIKVNYPSPINYTRKSYKTLGIKLLVHAPKKCILCNNPL